VELAQGSSLLFSESRELIEFKVLTKTTIEKVQEKYMTAVDIGE